MKKLIGFIIVTYLLFGHLLKPIYVPQKAFMNAIQYIDVTLYPIVLINNEEHLINRCDWKHIQEHVKQYQKDGVGVFYMIYIYQFARSFIQTAKWDQSYRQISYEREAFDAEVQIGCREKP